MNLFFPFQFIIVVKQSGFCFSDNFFITLPALPISIVHKRQGVLNWHRTLCLVFKLLPLIITDMNFGNFKANVILKSHIHDKYYAIALPLLACL